jgi:hypothetical protein
VRRVSKIYQEKGNLRCGHWSRPQDCKERRHNNPCTTCVRVKRGETAGLLEADLSGKVSRIRSIYFFYQGYTKKKRVDEEIYVQSLPEPTEIELKGSCNCKRSFFSGVHAKCTILHRMHRGVQSFFSTIVIDLHLAPRLHASLHPSTAARLRH